MFATSDVTVDQARERRREARRHELRSLSEQEARIKQRVTQIVREADDDGDWQAAGCSSSAQWLAQVSSSDHRTAARITRTSSALRSLPALDHALGTGALTLDQVAAAAEYATPDTDAELARIAVGKPPSDIALAARTIVPPKVNDDHALYERRALSMTWTRGRRELAFSGRLPLEQGVAFEQAIWSIAKSQRALDKQAGTLLDWQQSAADALVVLARQAGAVAGGVKRSPTTLIVHISDDGPPLLECAGPLSPETAERLVCDSRRLAIKPSGRDLVHSRVGRCASYAQQRALHKRSTHCQYPGCTAARELEAHHLIPVECGGRTELDNLILLCPRHHKLLHDHRIRTSGNGQHPVFADEGGRAITANQPHAPPRQPVVTAPAVRRIGARGFEPTEAPSKLPTLLCCQGRLGSLAELVVEAAREGAFDAAFGFAGGLAGGQQALVVLPRLGVMADALQRDHMERPIELAVAAAVEAVTLLLAARGIDGACASERRKRGLALHACSVAA
ncbi:MAG: HNH endonuclease [Actinomycetota bacterium]|nr:HNH endonuclease [Actinomycetota bacterium]